MEDDINIFGSLNFPNLDNVYLTLFFITYLDFCNSNKIVKNKKKSCYKNVLWKGELREKQHENYCQWQHQIFLHDFPAVSLYNLANHFEFIINYVVSSKCIITCIVLIRCFFKALTLESSRLISEAVSILPTVPSLCTPEASVNVLPSVLYLLTCALREVALIKDSSSQKTVSATLQALKQLTISPYTQNPKCSKDWIDLLQRFGLFISISSRNSCPDSFIVWRAQRT